MSTPQVRMLLRDIERLEAELVEARAVVDRVRALLVAMRTEANADWKDPQRLTYDHGADDQLMTDIRRLAAALEQQ